MPTTHDQQPASSPRRVGIRLTVVLLSMPLLFGLGGLVATALGLNERSALRTLREIGAIEAMIATTCLLVYGAVLLLRMRDRCWSRGAGRRRK